MSESAPQQDNSVPIARAWMPRPILLLELAGVLLVQVSAICMLAAILSFMSQRLDASPEIDDHRPRLHGEPELPVESAKEYFRTTESVAAGFALVVNSLLWGTIGVFLWIRGRHRAATIYATKNPDDRVASSNSRVTNRYSFNASLALGVGILLIALGCVVILRELGGIWLLVGGSYISESERNARLANPFLGKILIGMLVICSGGVMREWVVQREGRFGRKKSS